MNKKILYVTNSMEKNNTLGYRHSNIIKVLSTFFTVDLVDFAFTKIKKTFVKKVINKLFIFPDIYWLRLYKYKKVLREILKTQKYDIAVIAAVPHSFFNLASFIKKKAPNTKVIIDLTDPLSANVSFTNYLPVYKKYIGWYEKKHLKNVDQLIVLNEEIKQYYKKLYPYIKQILVIEQGTEKHSTPTRIKNSGTIDLIYAGMLYDKIREPYELYKAILLSSKSLHLSIYGSFKKKFIPPENEKLKYGGILDKEILNEKIASCDILVFIDNFYGIQSPGKILESLASNKPILFIYENPNSPSLKFVEKFNGVFYSKNKAVEIGQKINEIIENNYFFFERDLTTHYWQNIVKKSDYIN